MKILVLSLLRLGDVILHRELAQSLKNEYPGAQIDFVIDDQFRAVKELIPEVSKWHQIPRLRWQKILVERKQSPARAKFELQKMVADIGAESYDLVLNATHSRFSARLMDLISAKKKIGAQMINGKVGTASNRWQQYLNENFSGDGRSRFHYLELLHRSLEISFTVPRRRNQKKDSIYLQVLTSDEKKNWGLNRYFELFGRLRAQFPEKRIRVLCSPAEKKQVQNFFSEEDIFCVDLLSLQKSLVKAELLITGDTSVQHLAAQVGCRTLSLFLGSADPVKTAPWNQGARILSAQSPCFPCRHSDPCSQRSHLCAESIPVGEVLRSASRILLNLKEERHQEQEVKVQQRHFFIENLENPELDARVEQLAWSFYLSREPGVSFLPLASSAQDLMRDLGPHFVLSDFEQSYHRAQEFQMGLEEMQRRIRLLQQCVLQKDPKKAFQAQRLLVRAGLQKLTLQVGPLSDSLARLNFAMTRSPQDHFILLKELRAGLEQALELAHIRLQIFAHLQSLMKGGQDGRRVYELNQEHSIET